MRKTFIAILLCLSFQQAFACEFCGCSSGNYFIGPFPQFRKYFVGTRYTVRSFNTSVAADPSQFSKDFYQTVELWGGVNISKRWQLLMFLPYAINRQSTDDGVKQTNGIGDITLLANYSVFKTTSESGAGHQLWLGGGLKLPTGEFSVDQVDLVATANNQPGSGSLDYVLNVMHNFHFGDWGTSSVVNYKINQSANGFQFGNRLAASGFVYRTFSTLPAQLSPNVGLLYENLAQNKQHEVTLGSTGGSCLLAAAGLETSVRKFIVGFNVQLPVSQNFSDGQTSVKMRGMMHVTYTF